MPWGIDVLIYGMVCSVFGALGGIAIGATYWRKEALKMRHLEKVVSAVKVEARGMVKDRPVEEKE